MNRLSIPLLVLLTVSSISIAVTDDIPDLSKTPGVARPGLTKTKICSIKWGADERHVTPNMKKQVFANYGYSGYDDPHCIADAHNKTCEIDHLISRELGGADDVSNLWPQAYGGTPWNAHLKDRLENRLNKEVCQGRLSLKNAQQLLVNDWRIAYQKCFGSP
ncbi:HNH endonuclease signature motif containing protein [Methylomonas albis]|uniref:HNH endonuclease n=1 Tax=Methylomonas albis TaxID=1854563 RepID=A0ABR9CVE5_9GAMM|nr:HNH endonuclease signature motif containing protein [Methylomonas albis]MBD9354823.1 HNH endonuclease [Methylomonas albis]